MGHNYHALDFFYIIKISALTFGVFIKINILFAITLKTPLFYILQKSKYFKYHLINKNKKLNAT